MGESPLTRTQTTRHGGTAPSDSSGEGSLFHVVLHEPEIPNNTGNIGRTCVALGCALHLIRPLGFDTSEHALRRAGLDYWARLRVIEHDDWEGYLSRRVKHEGENSPRNAGAEGRLWVFTTKATRPVWEADLRPGDALVFGKETRGLPDRVLAGHPDRLVTLPMVEGERSLNLATAVCAALYEGVRQCVARGEAAIDERGRLVRRASGREIAARRAR